MSIYNILRTLLISFLVYNPVMADPEGSRSPVQTEILQNIQKKLNPYDPLPERATINPETLMEFDGSVIASNTRIYGVVMDETTQPPFIKAQPCEVDRTRETEAVNEVVPANFSYHFIPDFIPSDKSKIQGKWYEVQSNGSFDQASARVAERLKLIQQWNHYFYDMWQTLGKGSFKAFRAETAKSLFEVSGNGLVLKESAAIGVQKAFLERQEGL